MDLARGEESPYSSEISVIDLMHPHSFKVTVREDSLSVTL